MTGAAAPLARPASERDWMVVDSYCRQRTGAPGPAATSGRHDAAAGRDPGWPLRSAIATACPQLFPPL